MQYFLYALKNAFKVHGRASRPEFWWASFYLNLLYIPLLIIVWFLIKSPLYILGIIIFVITFLASMIIPWLFGIRRLHDSDRPGWWMLLGFIPIIGFYLLFLFVEQGDMQANKYGEVPPRFKTNKEHFRDAVFIFLLYIIFVAGSGYYIFKQYSFSRNYEYSYENELDDYDEYEVSPDYEDNYILEDDLLLDEEEFVNANAVPVEEEVNENTLPPVNQYFATYPDEVKELLANYFKSDVKPLGILGYRDGVAEMQYIPEDGIVVSGASYKVAEKAYIELYDELTEMGYVPFLTHFIYQLEGTIVDFAVTKSNNQFDTLNIVGIRAKNRNLSTAEIRQELEAIYEIAPFKIVSVQYDSVFAIFTGDISQDMMPFAEAVYKINPEVVDRSYSTLDEYIAGLRQAKAFGLYWE